MGRKFWKSLADIAARRARNGNFLPQINTDKLIFTDGECLGDRLQVTGYSRGKPALPLTHGTPGQVSARWPQIIPDTISSIPVEPANIPLISVVIPSRQRPELLVRCVESALQQTWNNLEVIAVLDGDTAGSAEALRQKFPGEPRLRILENAAREGASVARNRGVQAAQGEWIAFLDDDDAWLPEKLEKQMACALASQYQEPVVACQMLFKIPGGMRAHPQIPPSRPMSEYLYVRKGFPGEQGILPPQTVLAPRSLCLRVPFTPGLPRHEDGEWAMLISQESTVGFEFLAEPLVLYNSEPDGRERITEFRDWRYSMEFARSRRSLMTRRGYAGFVLSRCVEAAAYQGEWRALGPIVVEAFRHGSPSAANLAMAVWTCLQPPLRRVYRFFRRR